MWHRGGAEGTGRARAAAMPGRDEAWPETAAAAKAKGKAKAAARPEAEAAAKAEAKAEAKAAAEAEAAGPPRVATSWKEW